jgi:hypothetical protein
MDPVSLDELNKKKQKPKSVYESIIFMGFLFWGIFAIVGGLGWAGYIIQAIANTKDLTIAEQLFVVYYLGINVAFITGFGVGYFATKRHYEKED